VPRYMSRYYNAYRDRKNVPVVALVVLFAMVAGLLISCAKGPSPLKGVVLEGNTDPHKRSPLAGVEITATTGSTLGSKFTSGQVEGQTDPAGFFSLNLGHWVRRGQAVHLKFRHPGYQPVSLDEIISDKLYVINMFPVSSNVQTQTMPPVTTVISNVKIRYSMKSTESVNVGSAAKAFEVTNTGNTPCNGKLPCSPDGKWKASLGSISLSAGEGNEFRNVRLSCIAGPCPFTKVESDQYSQGGNKIAASVLNWSDTTTHLLEAEVYHPMISEVLRDSYPVIFGRTLNFSVPDTGEGVSIEAEVNGSPIVFPLGPSLCLSWANCTATTDKDHSTSYRCELKEGFGFK